MFKRELEYKFRHVCVCIYVHVYAFVIDMCLYKCVISVAILEFNSQYYFLVRSLSFSFHTYNTISYTHMCALTHTHTHMYLLHAMQFLFGFHFKIGPEIQPMKWKLNHNPCLHIDAWLQILCVHVHVCASVYVCACESYCLRFGVFTLISGRAPHYPVGLALKSLALTITGD